MKTIKTPTTLHKGGQNRASLLIRLGLAFVLGYAGIGGFINPDVWISFMPAFLGHFVSLKVMLDCISAGQIVLAVWLMTGRFLRLASLVTSGLFLSIILLNINTFLITFRDIGLLSASVALWFLDPKVN